MMKKNNFYSLRIFLKLIIFIVFVNLIFYLIKMLYPSLIIDQNHTIDLANGIRKEFYLLEIPDKLCEEENLLFNIKKSKTFKNLKENSESGEYFYNIRNQESSFYIKWERVSSSLKIESVIFIKNGVREQVYP